MSPFLGLHYGLCLVVSWGNASTITDQRCSELSHILHSDRLSLAHHLYPILSLSASHFLGTGSGGLTQVCRIRLPKTRGALTGI